MKSNIESYKQYGFDMPQKAIFRRHNNRIYSIMDFKDGDIVEFAWSCGKPSACALGNAIYTDEKGWSRLVNIKDLEAI